jgi:hypothetical protein
MNKITSIVLICLCIFSEPLFSQVAEKSDSTLTKGKLAITKRHPKAKHVVGIFATNNQFPIRLQDPSLMLVQNASLGLRRTRIFGAICLSYNLNLKNSNFFLEGGLTYVTVFHGYTTNNWLSWNGGRNSSYMNAYGILSTNLGAGYRIVTNTNKRLFDIQSGLSIGFTDNKKGAGNQDFDSFTYTDFNNNSGLIAISSDYKIVNRTFVGIYFGISKEIRVTDNLYLSATYLNQFGFSAISEHSYQYVISGLGVENVVKGSVSPRSRTFGLGLRWHFIK